MSKLLFGDCLELLPVIPDNRFDLICADMPYGTTRCKWDSVIDLEKLWPMIKRVLKPNGVIILFAQTPFDKVLGCSNLPMLRYEWIWEKTNATGFLNAGKMPLKAHENILVFYNKLPTFNPQKSKGHKKKTATREGVNSDIYGNGSVTTYDSTERHPRDVVVFKSDKQISSIQCTQKPVALLEYILKSYSNEGDECLDFCMGSGSLGIACENLNRKFTGIEKDLNNFLKAKERLANHE